MQITIEYMIMIPLLILEIILFPYATSQIMEGWADSRQALELQEIASNMGSSIQQVYSALNHTSIESCSVTNTFNFPAYVENSAYIGNATIRLSSESENSTKILTITLVLKNTQVSTSTTITLGDCVNWLDSTFTSNEPNPGILAQKFTNGTIQLSFI